MNGAQQVVRSLEKHIRKNGGDVISLLEKRHADKKVENSYIFHDGSAILVEDGKIKFSSVS